MAIINNLSSGNIETSASLGVYANNGNFGLKGITSLTLKHTTANVGFDIENCPNLRNLNFPYLEYINPAFPNAYFTIAYNGVLNTISLPNFVTASGQFSIYYNQSLTTLDFPKLTILDQDQTFGDNLYFIHNESLTSVNMPNFTKANEDIYINDNESLKSVSFSSSLSASYVDLHNNALQSGSIDNVIISLINGGVSGGFSNCASGANQGPSYPNGLLSSSILVDDRGWEVIVNDSDIAPISEFLIADDDGKVNRTTPPDVIISNFDISSSYSYTINLSGANYTFLSATNCTNLETLNCFGNNLNLLNISGATEITSLNCYYNLLTSLDVSTNVSMSYLICSHNPLASLNVSNNTALTYLDCSGNYNLTSLDVSSNTELIYLACSDSLLTSLDLSNNTALTESYCNYNSLTSLNVSGATALEILNCGYNSLTSLNVSSNTALESLDCGYNSLTSLNVNTNTALTYLGCYYNSLTSLNVSNNTALQTLNCSYNSLTSLNVSNNTALTTLNCYYNSLTSLNVSTNTALTYLNCGTNQLTSLDISNNTALTTLYCPYNPAITSGNWDTILHTLVQNELSGGYFVIRDTNHGGPDNPPSAAGLASGSILTSRGWLVYYD
jgi:Leucine-rich repeat (LRR) protein